MNWSSRLWLLYDDCHLTQIWIADPMPTLFSYWSLLSYFHCTTKLLLLPLLLLLLLLLSNYHTIVLLNTLLQRINIPGVVKLTTQLLRLINILWLPLCRINNFGWNTILEACCDPLYLSVISGSWCCSNRGRPPIQSSQRPVVFSTLAPACRSCPRGLRTTTTHSSTGSRC